MSEGFGKIRIVVSERKALEEAVARVGDRWTLLLVSALLDGPRRFNDLVDDLGGIAPNVLSQRLRHLEQLGILVATPYSTRPPRFVYQLTGSGLELAGVLRLLARWGAGQGPSGPGPAGGEPLRHPACGTPMDARWYCPTCATVVDDDAASDDGVRFL